jgi:hypothetical protein
MLCARVYRVERQIDVNGFRVADAPSAGRRKLSSIVRRAV